MRGKIVRLPKSVSGILRQLHTEDTGKEKPAPPVPTTGEQLMSALKKVPAKRWKRMERTVVKKTGGSPTPNSGATWHSKGDGKHGQWCQEVKSTNKFEYRALNTTLAKLQSDASKSGGTPMLIINFAKDNRRTFLVPSYAVPKEFHGDYTEPLPHNRATPYSSNKHYFYGENQYFVLSERQAEVRLGLAKSKGCVKVKPS